MPTNAWEASENSSAPIEPRRIDVGIIFFIPNKTIMTLIHIKYTKEKQ